MVKNKKFQKMPKISLAQKPDFGGGHHCFGPKTLLHFGPTFLVLFFHRQGGYCVVRPLMAQETMFRVPSGNAVKTDVS